MLLPFFFLVTFASKVARGSFGRSVPFGGFGWALGSGLSSFLGFGWGLGGIFGARLGARCEFAFGGVLFNFRAHIHVGVCVVGRLVGRSVQCSGMTLYGRRPFYRKIKDRFENHYPLPILPQ